MNKQVLKSLREIAASLPLRYHAHKSVRFDNVKGSHILRRYPKATDKRDHRIDPDKYYAYKTRATDTKANHERALKKAYQSGGFAAVNIYVNSLKR